MEFLLKNLNENQKRAVLHQNGPLLVLAGAGAGKTRVIAHRIAYLISNGIKPEKILAITFTNKAAEEMRERIKSLLGDLRLQTKRMPFVGTFHSLGVYILRNHGRSIEVPRSFSIFDRDDSLSLVKSVIDELGINPKQFQPSKIQAIISRYKGDLITCDDLRTTAGDDFFLGNLLRIWERYEEELKKQKALDFDDLIAKPVFLLRKDGKAKEYYQKFWEHILIDEYQDTNKAQYELSKILAEKHRNICIIGDIDQSIYSWRGADFRNIINFERDFPDHKSVVLEENYRSTQVILEAAAKVIEKNKMRKPKRMVALREGGPAISLFEAMDEQEEAEFVAHKIKEILKSKEKPSEIAVLYRANFQSRVLEESCLKHGIPYQVLGIQFYQRKEVKDIFSYLRASLNPESLMDIKRIINVPPRKIGKITLLKFLGREPLSGDAQKRIDEFLDLLKKIKEKIYASTPSDVIRFVIKETGYEKYLQEGDEEDKERLENLYELVNIASRYDNLKPPEGIEKFLSDAALMSEQDSLDNQKEAVRLMTVHSAKGLEFKYVFIVGLEEGLFPHIGFGMTDLEKEEEERRLFYVALTRAKEKLFLSFCLSRMFFGSKQLNMPSQFLSDIPQDLIEVEEYNKTEEFIEYE